MWTKTMQIKTYALNRGRNVIAMPADAEVKETDWNMLLVLEPRNVEPVKRAFWVIGCNQEVEDSLLERLNYVGAWHNSGYSTSLLTVWEERLEPRSGWPEAGCSIPPLW